MGWTIEDASRKLGAYNSGWFDIPNGWVADAPCLVVFSCPGSSGSDVENSALRLNGFVVSEFKNWEGWGYTHNCLCPKGVEVTIHAPHGVRYLKAKHLY